MTDSHLNHIFLISKQFPFICAVPDILTYDYEGNCEVCEVKSGLNFYECENALESYDTYCQVQTVLSIFNLKCARIIGMLWDNNTKDYDLHSSRVEYNQNFLPKNKEKLIKGYVQYLSSYFQVFYKFELKSEQKTLIFDLLNQHKKQFRKKRKYDTIDELKKQISKKEKSKNECLKMIEFASN